MSGGTYMVMAGTVGLVWLAGVVVLWRRWRRNVESWRQAHHVQVMQFRRTLEVGDWVAEARAHRSVLESVIRERMMFRAELARKNMRVVA